MNQIHRWSTSGHGSTTVRLPAGEYRLVSHQINPRTRADLADDEPPVSLETDDGLAVRQDDTVIRTGPGDFRVAIEADFTITFGEPRCVELWSVEPAPVA